MIWALYTALQLNNIVIAENLIGGILDEVQSALGYQSAWSKANNAIFNAVLAKQTNSYGYSDLAAQFHKMQFCNTVICAYDLSITRKKKTLLASNK